MNQRVKETMHTLEQYIREIEDKLSPRELSLLASEMTALVQDLLEQSQKKAWRQGIRFSSAFSGAELMPLGVKSSGSKGPVWKTY